MRKKSKSRKQGEAAKLEMTPMIDVVFQLLIFFLVTLKQEDILSQLNAIAPAPDPEARPDEQPPTIEIQVHEGGFIWRGRPVKIERLRRDLKRLSGSSDKTMIVLKVTENSRHEYLVQAMDACYSAGLRNLAVFTM